MEVQPMKNQGGPPSAHAPAQLDGMLHQGQGAPVPPVAAFANPTTQFDNTEQWSSSSAEAIASGAAPAPKKQSKPRTMAKPWEPEEDMKLASLVENSNSDNVKRVGWSQIAFHLDGRSAKQCRERYVNILRPDVKKGQWTEEEDNHIIRLRELGQGWSKIAKDLPGRSDNDVKNRWHCKMGTRSRKKRREGADKYPSTKRPKHAILPAVQLNVGPKIGQRLQMRQIDGEFKGGAITNVEPLPGQPMYKKLTIVLENGISIFTAYPNAGIQLIPMETIPMESKYSEKEVTLSHQLINLQSTSSEEDSKKQPIEEQEEEVHEDYLFEHLANMAKTRTSNIGSEDERHGYNGAKTTDIDYFASACQQMQAKHDIRSSSVESEEDGHDSDDTGNVANVVSVATARHKKRRMLPTQANRLKNPQPRKVSPSLKTHRAPSSSDSSSDGKPPRKYVHSSYISKDSTWPMTDIAKPHPNDVLIGRGGGTNYHPGNIRWRQFVETLKPDYRVAERNGKPLIAMSVVREWRSQTPPGRFLKVNDETSLWDDVGDDGARIKCSQALRERKATKLQLKDGKTPSGPIG